MSDVELSCRCGELKGIARQVSGNSGNRCVCYCEDCQAFARYLEQADIMDAHGGTEVFQMSAGQIEFTDGEEQLACLKLSPNGLHRWYAKCCKTPVANTLASKTLPFAGMIHSIFKLPDDSSREAVFGPVLSSVHGRFAYGDTEALGLHPKAPPGLVLRFLRKAFIWRLQGAASKSPFHQQGPTDGFTVLTLDQRKALARRSDVLGDDVGG